jgi:hypothetical protein
LSRPSEVAKPGLSFSVCWKILSKAALRTASPEPAVGASAARAGLAVAVDRIGTSAAALLADRKERRSI